MIIPPRLLALRDSVQGVWVSLRRGCALASVFRDICGNIFGTSSAFGSLPTAAVTLPAMQVSQNAVLVKGRLSTFHLAPSSIICLFSSSNPRVGFPHF